MKKERQSKSDGDGNSDGDSDGVGPHGDAGGVVVSGVDQLRTGPVPVVRAGVQRPGESTERRPGEPPWCTVLSLDGTKISPSRD